VLTTGTPESSVKFYAVATIVVRRRSALTHPTSLPTEVSENRRYSMTNSLPIMPKRIKTSGLFFVCAGCIVAAASGCTESTPPTPEPLALQPLQWSISPDRIAGTKTMDNGVYRFEHSTTSSNDYPSSGPLSGSLVVPDQINIEKIAVSPPTRTWEEPVTSFTLKIRVDNPDSREQDLVPEVAGQPAFTVRVFQGTDTTGPPMFTQHERGRMIRGNNSAFFRFTLKNDNGFELGTYTVQVFLPDNFEPIFSAPIYLQ
jgi:hypothetical protein